MGTDTGSWHGPLTQLGLQVSVKAWNQTIAAAREGTRAVGELGASADFTDTIAARQERDGYARIARAEAIKAIRDGLKRRSGKAWSVKGDRGTAYGWLTISAPPKRCTARDVPTGELDEYGNPVYELRGGIVSDGGAYMTPEDSAELAALLGLDGPVNCQGHSVAASTGHYIEAIARAEGRKPSSYGVRYWD